MVDPLHHLARAYRKQAECYAATADYYSATSNTKFADFYRSMSVDYIDMADETEEQIHAHA